MLSSREYLETESLNYQFSTSSQMLFASENWIRDHCYLLSAYSSVLPISALLWLQF